ncbi:hypothetical protein KDK88_03815 [bacterium]|nr:hypothetical protein [bacterium]
MIRKHAALPLMVLALVAVVGCRSAHVTSAILYIDQQMYQRAVDVLHEGLEYSPDEPEAFFYLGESHSHLAEEAVGENDYLAAKLNYEKAYDYYLKALALDPALSTRVQESLDYNYLQRSKDAANDMRLAQSKDGEERDRYFESAEGQYRLAFASLPDSTAPIKNIARMKMFQANREADPERQQALLGQSLTLLDQVLAARPDAYDLQSDKAGVLNQMGRNEESRAIYDRLVLEHPDDTGLLLAIADLAVQEERYEQAADLYTKVAGLYENDEELDNDDQIYPLTLQAANYYGLPGVLRYEDALAQYARAVEMEDANTGAPKPDTLLQKERLHHDYAGTLLGEGDAMTDAARAQYEACVNTGRALTNLDPENRFGWFYMGSALFKLGRNQEGTEAMQTYERLEAQRQ